jgi:cyanophycin synthetase
VGDGKHSILELIEEKNIKKKDALYKGSTSSIKIPEVQRIFGSSFMKGVPPKGKTVIVSDRANLSLGGEAQDVTEKVHPDYEKLLGPAIRSLNLKICGVDVLATDISKAPKISGAKIIEMNAAPGLLPHTRPHKGKGQRPASRIVDLLEKQAW